MKTSNKLTSKPNPFEVHINKQKMTVLGRKTKNDRGLPGVSRAKALKKRKETLLQEYKLQNKSNKFRDRRIGEWNSDFTNEDKTMARFAAIRKKMHKKSIFNLADDEVLTHRGQMLAEIEKFDDPKSDDEESEDEDKGNLGKNFIGEAHFGGGMLKRTGVEGAKSHKELIDELIAESKKRKAEKQKTKEATLELTEKLDSEWKDLLPLLNTKQKKIDIKKTEEKVVDDYDKVMRELRFEARGTVSDKLKTEEQTIKEEEEKLYKLEKERQERMVGFEDNKHKSHRSADDLDDDFVYESDSEYMLSYNKEGESNLEVEAELNGKKINEENRKQADDDSNQNSGDEEDNNDDDDEGGVSSTDTDSEDNLSDLKGDSSAESDEEQEVEDNTEDVATTEEQSCNTEKLDADYPHGFTIPDTYDDLKILLEDETTTKQFLILERMMKSNHPSLAEKNKEKLSTLFVYLLQYLNDHPDFAIFSSILPILFELGNLDPESTLYALKEVINEKHQEFKKRPKRYPATNELLVFFKLISCLFSTSDFRHSVVTPSFIFIEQILGRARVKTTRDVTFGLFLVTLILEFTTLSRRYLSAAIIFLGGVLHMAIPKRVVKIIKVNPPFVPISSLLVLDEDCSLNDTDLKMSLKSDGNVLKISAIYTTLKLIEEYYNHLQLPSIIEMFGDIKVYLELLPTKFYPSEVRRKYDEVRDLLQAGTVKRSLNYIVLEAKKPKALRLYDPKIEEVFDCKRRNKWQSKEKLEREKLVHKLKKETKGALREIRRDVSFLGRVKIQQQVQSDKERREKVKRIYSEAAFQQSELNSLDRQKKRKN